MGTVDVTGGIITGGLGRPACEQIITRAFHLYCDALPVGEGGGGGPYPRPAHNVIPDGGIQDFYKEVDLSKPANQDDRAFDLSQKYRVMIRLKIREREHSKEFVVDRHRKNLIVKAVNFINKTRDNITITISKVSAATKQLKFKVKKMKFWN